MLTVRLLGFIAGYSTEDRVLIAHGAVLSTLSVPFGSRSVVLSLSSSMFFTTVSLQAVSTGHVSEAFLHISFSGVPLAGSLAVCKISG